MNEILDGYKQFFDYVNKESFFKFGLDNIITIDKELISNNWKKLLDNINNKSKDLFIRSFGRNGRKNNIFEKLYNDVFGININFDPTNNSKPSRLIQNLTGYKTNKTIFNYQISHVFGNTKNVYCFTAPWNIVLIPKIIDPFTGHEAKGVYVDEFQKTFKKYIFEYSEKEIIEYNKIMEKLQPEIIKWVNNNVIEKDKNNILKEFEYIVMK